jgi:hypothetical protein
MSRDPIGENGGVNLYGFCRNNSIFIVDLFGLKIKVIELGITKEEAEECLEKFEKHVKGTVGENIYRHIKDGKWELRLVIGRGSGMTYVAGGQTGHLPQSGKDEDKVLLVYWDCCMGVMVDKDGRISPGTALAHELGHGLRYLTDTDGLMRDSGTNDENFDNLEEKRVITEIEHPIAQKHGEAKRKSHSTGNGVFPASDVGSTIRHPKMPDYRNPKTSSGGNL